MNSQNDHDTYIILPNFVETGTLLGGMFKACSMIETSTLALAIGLSVFLFLPFDLIVRIIVPCLTTLPPALLAFIGISGESLFSFLVTFPKFLKNRRAVGKETLNDAISPKSEEQELEKQKRVRVAKPMKDHGIAKTQKSAKGSMEKKHRTLTDSDFPAGFDGIREYKIKQKLRPCKRVERRKTVKSKSDR